MREKLFTTLCRVIDLLGICGEKNRAEWFGARLEILIREPSHSERFQQLIRELRGVLAGMGSFSDLSLSPSSDVELSRQEARDLQWQLIDELDEAIGELLEGPANTKL